MYEVDPPELAMYSTVVLEYVKTHHPGISWVELTGIESSDTHSVRDMLFLEAEKRSSEPFLSKGVEIEQYRQAELARRASIICELPPDKK